MLPTIPLPIMPAAETLADMLPYYAQLEPVLDALPDLVFFVKDRDARYALVNRTLATRCGCDADLAAGGALVLLFTVGYGVLASE